MDLFGIGLGELLLILVLALVVIGPERLPEVARQLGRMLAELRREADQLTAEFQRSLELAAQERREQRRAAGSMPGGPPCPSCGFQGDAGARFCARCGAALAAPLPEGERRT
ncbi:MAG TPA: Sec-independent protein translocase protein TatB [Chloroflexota bacterium]|nr:Sec-independent protein translocase protein TatB [Chloroflexota bacterium]